MLAVDDGQAVKAGAKAGDLGSAHPSDHHRIRRYVRFENVEEASPSPKQIDDVTGLSTLVVIDPKRGGKARQRARPASNCSTRRVRKSRLPRSDHAVSIAFQVGSIISVGRRSSRFRRRRCPRRVCRRVGQDPRHHRRSAACVAELFEARTPKDASVLAETTGTISFGKDTKGKQRLVITDLDGMPTSS